MLGEMLNTAASVVQWLIEELIPFLVVMGAFVALLAGIGFGIEWLISAIAL